MILMKEYIPLTTATMKRKKLFDSRNSKKKKKKKKKIKIAIKPTGIKL